MKQKRHNEDLIIGFLEAHEAGPKSRTRSGNMASRSRAFSAGSPSTAAWKYLRPSDCASSKQRTPSSRSCWPKRNSTRPCCGMSWEKSGEADWSQASGRLSAGYLCDQPTAGLPLGADQPEVCQIFAAAPCHRCEPDKPDEGIGRAVPALLLPDAA